MTCGSSCSARVEPQKIKSLFCWTRCDRTTARPGPQHDHTIWKILRSCSGPETPGRSLFFSNSWSQNKEQIIPNPGDRISLSMRIFHHYSCWWIKRSNLGVDKKRPESGNFHNPILTMYVLQMYVCDFVCSMAAYFATVC